MRALGVTNTHEPVELREATAVIASLTDLEVTVHRSGTITVASAGSSAK
jgi:hypothetical protein